MFVMIGVYEYVLEERWKKCFRFSLSLLFSTLENTINTFEIHVQSFMYESRQQSFSVRCGLNTSHNDKEVNERLVQTENVYFKTFFA